MSVSLPWRQDEEDEGGEEEDSVGDSIVDPSQDAGDESMPEVSDGGSGPEDFDN